MLKIVNTVISLLGLVAFVAVLFGWTPPVHTIALWVALLVMVIYAERAEDG